jgi:hypothetical protein
VFLTRSCDRTLGAPTLTAPAPIDLHVSATLGAMAAATPHAGLPRGAAPLAACFRPRGGGNGGQGGGAAGLC